MYTQCKCILKTCTVVNPQMFSRYRVSHENTCNVNCGDKLLGELSWCLEQTFKWSHKSLEKRLEEVGGEQVEHSDSQMFVA